MKKRNITSAGGGKTSRNSNQKGDAQIDCTERTRSPHFVFADWEILGARAVLKTVVKALPSLVVKRRDPAMWLFKCSVAAPASGKRHGHNLSNGWKQTGVLYGGDDCRLLLDCPANLGGGMHTYGGDELAALIDACFGPKSATVNEPAASEVREPANPEPSPPAAPLSRRPTIKEIIRAEGIGCPAVFSIHRKREGGKHA